MNEFIEYLHEVFVRFGPISAKRMFGGYGIYHDGLMFALVVDDTLYLKADAENVDAFVEADLPPFQYLRQGKLTRLGYYQAPPKMLEQSDEAAIWARRSFAAAVRAQVRKNRSRL